MTVKQLVQLAKDCEASDPIDWGMLSIDEESAYELMASQVLEKFSDCDKTILMASVVKLIVENFVLNLKLRQRVGDDN